LGIRVRNVRGDRWTSYGDDHYFDKVNEDNRQVLHWALRRGIEDITETFEAGKFNIEIWNSQVNQLIPQIDPFWVWPEPESLIDFDAKTPPVRPKGQHWIGRPPFMIGTEVEADGFVGLDLRGHMERKLLVFKEFKLTGKPEYVRADKHNVASILLAAEHYISNFDQTLHGDLGYTQIKPKSKLLADPWSVKGTPSHPTFPTVDPPAPTPAKK